MKSFSIKLIVCFSLVVLVSGCGEDFLDLAPESNANVENFYKTVSDANSAVLAAYASLQSGDQYRSNFYTLFEYRSDNLQPTSTSNSRIAISEFDAGPANEIVDNTWSSIYNTIFRCNELLDNVDDIIFDENLKAQYKGEARFIRALSYFNAVRIWGEVPLVLRSVSTQESLNVGRSSVEEVYDAVEEDLVFATESLPAQHGGSDAGRAVAGAARALLAKVLVYRQKWPEAAAQLQQVIAPGTFSLLSDVADVFEVSNKDNEEMIFAIKFSKNIVGEGHGFLFTGLEDGTTAVTQDLVASYDPQDARGSLMQLVPSGTDFIIAKYFDELSSANEAGNDIPVLRYAEVLLLRAEALNELGYEADGEAFEQLNAIRQRSGLDLLTSADLPDQDSFRAAIYRERRWELALEADRWPDLVRTGTALSALNGKTINGFTYDIDENDLLYPIPLSEIQRMDNESLMYQNEGYD